MLLCMVTKDLTNRYNAGEIIREIAPIVGGSGGGRPTWPRPADPNLRNWKRHLAGWKRSCSEAEDSFLTHRRNKKGKYGFWSHFI